MTETAFRESTKPLLRPHQVEAAENDIAGIKKMLDAPRHVRSAVQDPGQAARQLVQLGNDLERQRPRPYAMTDLDSAVRRHNELVETIVNGMPTQAEMRKNPPGAVDKHRAWEERNKTNILELKNIKLRLHAGGHLDELRDARDVANIERLRPAGGANELNMDNAQITGQSIYLPSTNAGPATVLSDEELETLEDVAPKVRAQVGTLSNEQRAEVKELIGEVMKGLIPEIVAAVQPAPTPASKKRGRPKKQADKPISEAEKARRAAASERMKKRHAAKREAEAA